jgi:hypothetical protein
MTPATFDEAWAQALSTLEVDVATAEAMLNTDHLPNPDDVARLAAWRPPVDLGPLPASLLDRARALVARQQATAQAITRAMVVNRRHLHALASLTAPAAPARPVYIDVEG